ncbi:non-ribosomal peptide synthetase [Paenibacillus assamensis]|uniref:non-ribosomal peptide synthetase n=1 Tax=Paenibacillus assamensis TaxID=311244 RepID=UPI0003F9DFA7|nr:non-ribosomal peptide synthetase [Paenibacillus assamensis]
MNYEIENIYTLTPLQEGMLFHSLLDPESNAYFEQFVFTLSGQIEVALLEKSFNQIIERFDVLRTVFIYKESEQPLQVVLRKVETNIPFVDLTDLSPLEQQQYVEEFKNREKEKGFDLQQDVLIRLSLFQTTSSTYKVVFSFHHIIMDGWCLGIIAKHLFGVYHELQQGKWMPNHTIYPFSDYLTWLNAQDSSSALQYWSDYLRDFENQTLLPSQHSYNPLAEFKYCRHSFRFSEETSRDLLKLASEQKVTISTVFHVMWGILLQKYNHSDDVVFGTVISGRPPEIVGIEEMVGLFINTVPIRVTGSCDMTLPNLLQNINVAMAEANTHGHVSLADIQSLTTLKQHLIQHIMVFENYPLESELIDSNHGNNNQLSISDVVVEEQVNYDFDVTVFPGDEIEVRFTYNGNTYEESFVQRMEFHLKQLVNQMIDNSQITLGDLSIITEEEHAQIVQLFNGKKTNFEHALTKTVHQLFEERVLHNPHAIAVKYREQHMTYGQLNDRANQIARRLVRLGLQPGDFVGIMMERSPLMLQSILAIWKAGAAYIPLDMSHPEERIMSIMIDSDARILLSEANCATDTLKQRLGAKLVELDEQMKVIEQEESINLDLPISVNDLAYCLFTSGSTGQPKGVMIEHLGMLNHILAQQEALGLSQELVFAQNASHCFDISVWQFVCGPTLGGTTVIIPDDIVMDPRKCIERIQTEAVTLLEVVPSYLTVLMDLIEQDSIVLSNLSLLMITGETATPAIVKRWFSLCPTIPMINAYGPAEASDDVCQYKFDEYPSGSMEQIPIGSPLANVNIYIVDQHFQLCPEGVTGEICVSGIAVGRGYLNDEERTQRVFLTDPFTSDPGVRMYRTGDLGKWRKDGMIEFVGRRDHQVKVRGFRIELGEIENHLASHPLIIEVASVVWKEGEESYICAYYKSNQAIHDDELKSYLSRYLPSYMVPACFMRLEEMPLNGSGKIDRQQLPRPSHRVNDEYIAPRNTTDEMLCEIWSEVLGPHHWGIEHNFFNCGGHSLKATVLISKIYNRLDVNVSVRDVFRLPTICEMSDYIHTLTPARIEQIPVAEKCDYYPVSSMQQRMYVLHELEDKRSVAYNMPSAYRIQGELDVARLEQAVQALIRRHDLLRTVFETIDGVIVQRECTNVSFAIERSEGSEVTIDSAMRAFVRPFYLEEAPLLRMEVLKINEQDHILLVDMHHIISDGISGQIIVNETIALYTQQQLPELALQYKDYAVWQQQRLSDSRMVDHKGYWLQQFSGSLPLLNLPLDYRRPVQQSFAGNTLRFTAGAELTAQLNQFASRNGATLYHVLLAAYYLLLNKYSAQHDIIIGTPVAGRNHPDLHNMLGMFVNTLALRIKSQPEQTFEQIVDTIKELSLEAMEHQEYPFEQLLDELDVKRDTSRNPLFDTMFNLFDAEEHEIQLDNLHITPQELNHQSAKFDLMLDALTETDNIYFDLQYCTDLFKESTAKQLSSHYLYILDQVASDPSVAIGVINVLSDTESRHLIQQFSGVQKDYDFSKNAAQRFEQYAISTPDHVAVIYEHERISYRELNEHANRLAHYLLRQQIAREEVVAVMLDRTPHFIKSVLAVWKAGAAYVPIDPAYGMERQRNIVQDSGASLWITLSEYKETVQQVAFEGTILFIDEIEQQLLSESVSNPKVESDIHDLAYVLFTSGSTGKPKGVMIEHIGMLNHILAEADELHLDESLVFAQNANVCFDISVWQFFGPLAIGGTTVIYSNALILDVETFLNRMDDDGITLLEVVPTYLSIMMDVLEKGHLVPSNLRMLMITGEAVKPETVKRWFRLCSHIPMVNAYGPAEASDDSIQYLMKQAPEDMQLIPIGIPIPNVNVYVVDEAIRLCPLGVVGEICIGGLGVGRGYIRDSERTKGSFILDPFSDVPGQTIYRTGDMGRWLADGTVEYFGRQDFQVKIRGFRIELEEIEAVLLQQSVVKEAVVKVLTNEGEDPYLCAYLTSNSNEKLDLESLKSELSIALPYYMVPTYFVNLEAMPLLDNGKINRNALPEPNLNVGTTKVAVDPTSKLESHMVEIWAEVLGHQQIGTNYNFFELGGDSIKAIQISSRLSALGYRMKIKDLFQYPQIAQLSPWVTSENREIDQSAVEGEVPFTPIQHWFFQQSFVNAHHWNQSVMLYNPEGYDAKIVEQVWGDIVKHHDALRMVYKDEKGSVIQINQELSASVPQLEYVDVSHLLDTSSAILQHAESVQSSIHLADGPLVKLALYHTENGDHLFIVIHHLVVDGVSWRILFEDFAAGYMQLTRNEQIVFPSKTDSYKYWAEQLLKYANSKTLTKEMSYWAQVNAMNMAPLPKESLSNSNDIRVKHNRKYSFELQQDETGLLLGPAHVAYGTEINDLLLSALGIALQQWAGHEQVAISLEGHGREELLDKVNISRTVGWFTSVFPIGLDMGAPNDLSYTIKNVKESLRRVPNKGIGYGILKYLTAVEYKQGMQFELEPEIKFNYLGQFDTDINSGVFQVSPLDCGQNESMDGDREVALNIGGLIENGKLRIMIDYNANEFSNSHIAKLADAFQSALLRILEHCISKEEKELTASDVGAEDLSSEELDEILLFYSN